MIESEEIEKDFDNEEYPRVVKRFDCFEDLIAPSYINFRLEWKCNAPIIFFESSKNDYRN